MSIFTSLYNLMEILQFITLSYQQSNSGLLRLLFFCHIRFWSNYGTYIWTELKANSGFIQNIIFIGEKFIFKLMLCILTAPDHMKPFVHCQQVIDIFKEVVLTRQLSIRPIAHEQTTDLCMFICTFFISIYMHILNRFKVHMQG